MLNEIIGVVLMVIGGLFYILSSIGLIRMPDAFNRLQASTKATTLGSFSILLGVGIYEPEFLVKAIVIIIFIAIKNPIGSSVLARTAYYNGTERAQGTVTSFPDSVQGSER